MPASTFTFSGLLAKIAAKGALPLSTNKGDIRAACAKARKRATGLEIPSNQRVAGSVAGSESADSFRAFYAFRTFRHGEKMSRTPFSVSPTLNSTVFVGFVSGRCKPDALRYRIYERSKSVTFAAMPIFRMTADLKNPKATTVRKSIHRSDGTLSVAAS